jgi:hypothetical protein
MVRKDLFNWPSSEEIDGSAHICGDEGLVFLFNPSSKVMTAEFSLSVEGIGWKNEGKVLVYSEYPEDEGKTNEYHVNDKVTWELAPESAVVLKVLNVANI